MPWCERGSKSYDTRMDERCMKNNDHDGKGTYTIILYRDDNYEFHRRIKGCLEFSRQPFIVLKLREYYYDTIFPFSLAPDTKETLSAILSSFDSWLSFTISNPKISTDTLPLSSVRVRS